MRCLRRWWCRCARSWRMLWLSWRGRKSGVAELEDRLRQTSRNSSRPPSGDGLAKPLPRSRSLRKKTGRKPGGQDGHRGQTLAQVARPCREERHEPACCRRCGAGLAGRPVTAVERRQVFDLPPVKVKLTEQQLIERECGCGHRTRGAAAAGADAPVQYGPGLCCAAAGAGLGSSRRPTPIVSWPVARRFFSAWPTGCAWCPGCGRPNRWPGRASAAR